MVQIITPIAGLLLILSAWRSRRHLRMHHYRSIDEAWDLAELNPGQIFMAVLCFAVFALSFFVHLP